MDSSKAQSPARLIVGLGNPGKEYEWTRHNVGFHVLDRLAEKRGVLFRGPSRLEGWDGPRGFEWGEAPANADALEAGRPASASFLLKPGTYMNRSGDIVAPIARWLARRSFLDVRPAALPAEGEIDSGPSALPDFEPDPASILVVYDDMDLEPGRLRLRPHGGHGGQNGMRSIMDRLQTRDFPRLRVGIGRAGTDAARHVLSPFSPAEREDLEITIAEAVESLEAWLDGETFADVMTRFHSRWN
ncbi:aminoacyl-tRNA hydrolase [Planctomycetes bacterium Poly30]